MLSNRECAVRIELGSTFGDSRVTAGYRDSQAAKRAKCSIIAEQTGPRGHWRYGDTGWLAAGGSAARVWISKEELLYVEVVEEKEVERTAEKMAKEEAESEY